MLHIACFHSAPLQALQALLEAVRSADPMIELACLTSGDKSTPLLIAYAASTDAPEMLPRENLKEALVQGMAPGSRVTPRH
jgi:hypothetical protein